MIEVRDYARGIACAETIEGKLRPPPELSDRKPGEPLRLESPGRPPPLIIAPARAVKVPPIAGMRDPRQRARILHALANHELQAIELFAWALLAFPEAPAALRRGLIAILADEQRHLELYIARLAAHGAGFGDYPVTGHFWNRLDAYGTPLAFLCAMGLTFENANLDFAGDYRRAAAAAGDHETAAALDQVHEDEERHVRFAFRWVRRLKRPDETPWQAYLRTIEFPLGPSRARGKRFDVDSRRRAGLDEEFIEELAAASPVRPSGAPR
jgi:uncharacterized ferritin-like protein (DUF455 family)